MRATSVLNHRTNIHKSHLYDRLEALNSILFHQLSNNPNVVYSILRSHQVFEGLGTFTLAKGLREVRRIQQMKDERAAQLAAKAKGGKPASTTTANSDPNAPEKISLLRGASEDVEDALDAAERGENLREDSVGGGAPLPPTPASDGENPLSRATSPDSGDNLPAIGRPRMSEKARGKMRERSVSLETLDPELERIAAQGVGRNGFIPTQEWVRFRRLYYLEMR